MRLVPMIVALMLTAVPVAARECRLPLLIGDAAVPTSFLSCLLDEISDLKRDQTRLRREVNELTEALSELPGQFRNEDGVVSADEDRKLATASFRLTSRSTSDTTSLPVDQDAMETLCAGTGGCTVTLFLRPEGLRPADPVDIVATGPCLFDYDPKNGVWVRGGACGEAGALTGTDGNGTPGGNDGGEIVAAAGGACLLADSDPGLTVGPGAGLFGRDHSRGLFLVAAPSLRDNGSGRFRCELKIE